jgi:hypothetical protein
MELDASTAVILTGQNGQQQGTGPSTATAPAPGSTSQVDPSTAQILNAPPTPSAPQASAPIGSIAGPSDPTPATYPVGKSAPIAPDFPNV